MTGPTRSNISTHRRERRHRPTYERRPSLSSVTDVPVIPEIEEELPRPEFHGAESSEPVRFYDIDQPYYEFTNFAPSPIYFQDKKYPTAEHLFQAHKFLSRKPHLAERIRQLPTARAALEEASRLHRLQRQDWFDVNIGVMEEVLEAKFRQHRHLQQRLLDTGSRDLVEASPIDSIWGIGADGNGRNELGKALMKLRDTLQAEEPGRGGVKL